jgi:redox-sensitive bicupin YhaK (pirin superfamily)
MIHRRPAEERGRTHLGWLDGRHSFSFGDYHDAEFMGYRALRVLNDDRVAPGGGFDPHPHRDMEIVTYMLEGALEHQDSMGNGSVIRPGEIQRMSAGKGVVHSERNASKTKPVHLLQIWLLPRVRGKNPSYEQKTLAEKDLADRLHLAASGHPGKGAVTIDQDADLWIGRLAPGAVVRHTFAAGRSGWVQVARGSVEVNGVALAEGDGAAVADEREIAVTGKTAAEVLVFDLV